MHYLQFVMCMLCLWKLCEGAEFTGRRCDIPTGKQYKASRFRPLHYQFPRKYRPGQSVTHGVRIAITCLNDIYGDAIHRQHKSRCLNGRWSPALPGCGAKNRCHAPELIADAKPSRPLDHHVTFPHGTTITFTCNPGTLPTGNGDTQCQDGSWTPVTLQCEDKRKCQIPTDVQYEDAIFRSKERPWRTYDLEESVNEGTEIVVICNNETHQSVCENGKWIPDIPSCIRERDQPEIKCAIPPRFRNARYQSLQGKTSFEIGTIIRYMCKTGYSLAEESITVAVCTCDEEHDSFWVGPNMTCLPNEMNKCLIPTGQHYADATYRPLYSSHPRRYQAGQTVDHKKRIVVICKNDVYGDAVHNVHKSRCFKGEWSPGLPSCHIKGRCRAPHVIPNAKPSRPLNQYVTFPHGEVITFTCKHGMHPIGNGKIVCENGKWTPMEFRCAGM